MPRVPPRKALTRESKTLMLQVGLLSRQTFASLSSRKQSTVRAYNKYDFSYALRLLGGTAIGYTIIGTPLYDSTMSYLKESLLVPFGESLIRTRIYTWVTDLSYKACDNLGCGYYAVHIGTMQLGRQCFRSQQLEHGFAYRHKKPFCSELRMGWQIE